MKKLQNLKRNELMTIGFVLLMPGLLFATVIDGSRLANGVGVVLLIIASAAFGASINANKPNKK